MACGVSPDTADMHYRIITEPYLCEDIAWYNPILGTMSYSEAKDIYGDETTPAWSLSSLLGLLPREIETDDGSYSEKQKYTLLLYPYAKGWQIDYQYCEDDECHSPMCAHDESPIEACVKAIEWLTANGYKLNTPAATCKDE